MSTIKSSAEDLTLNADGANNDIIFQSNGSNVATLDQAGLLTATTFAGSGASLTALNATNLGSGTVPTARLGSGTASSSTILYGDQTYKTAPSGGLVLIASSVDHTAGGTTYAAITIDQCFSSTYQNYLIIGSFGVEANGNVKLQWRVGGSGSESTHTTGNYKYVGMDYENENASLTKNAIAHDSDSELPIAINVTPHISDGNYFQVWVYSPQIADADTTARLESSTYDANNDIRDRTVSLNSLNVDATGFSISNSSGNMDEHGIRVYGLIDS